MSILSLTPWTATPRVEADRSEVTVIRTPQGGIQPQVELDSEGVLHLIYLKGDPSSSDIYYARKVPDAAGSGPIRVNTEPGSAIAIGSVRGPHLAIGKNGRVHVAWMGCAPRRTEASGAYALHSTERREGSLRT
jgi:hypothetical protein